MRRFAIVLALLVLALLAFEWLGTNATSDDEMFSDPRERTTFRMEMIVRMVSAESDHERRLLVLDSLMTQDVLPERAVLDGWSRAMLFGGNEGSFWLGSAGPDGEMGTIDDIAMWVGESGPDVRYGEDALPR